MRLGALFLLLLTFSMFLSACTVTTPSTECNCPELSDSKCPVSEHSYECTKTECPACETAKPQIKEIIKYICPNGLETLDKEECGIKEEQLPPYPFPEKDFKSYINNVTVRPACIYGEAGGVVIFDFGTIASEVEFQVDEGSGYKNLLTVENTYGTTKTFSFVVNKYKYSKGDFSLVNEKEYKFRLKIYFPSFNQTEYSTVYSINAINGSDYRSYPCN